MLLLTPLLLTLSILEVSPTPDYYWRRFHGRVPFDAVVAARINQNTIYIGSAPFETQGLFLGPITECSKNVTVTTWSRVNDKTAHSTDELTEILCSPRPHNSFKWVSVTSETLLNQKGLVEGGFEAMNKGTNNGVLYIGRIKDDKQTVKIGKVAGYHPNEEKRNVFYYADDQHEQRKNSFEVLIYEDRNATNDKMCQSHLRSIWPLDYYWRKYTGEVPHDAFIAIDKPRTYIGRAPFANTYFAVGPIVQGVKNIPVTGTSSSENGEVHYVGQFVEILCTPTPNRFSWVSTTAENLLKQSGLIEGGFHHVGHSDVNIGVLYIGRTLDSVPKIGKVVGYHKTEQVWNALYYASGSEGLTSSYEALTYSEL